MARSDRAGRDASRHALFFLQVLVVDPIDAQRALLHHADIFIELARAVGARPGAELAADAEILVHQHDAVLGALEGGTGRANGDARRLFAMQTGPWEVHGAAARALARLEAVDAVEPHARGRI